MSRTPRTAAATERRGSTPPLIHAYIDAFLAGTSLPALRRRLLAWYARHARDLPWRRTRDPYAVWISEIMLQQTTVTAVIPYFERFLAAFPTVFALADADEHDVLKLWEGLGYYSRGRNLHRAARMIVDKFDGHFPSDVATLQSLPGIGRYTAGAIASFAHDTRAPIVEANTLRLYARLLAFRSDPRSSSGQSLLWNFAEQLLPAHNCGRFNQSLMELGATVCTPAEPRCADCPLQRDCIAFRNNSQPDIPLAKPRQEITPVVEAAIAIRRRGQYLLRQRAPGERWAGLWDFPRFELQNGQGNLDPLRDTDRLTALLQGRVAELTGLTTEIDSLVMEFTHAVTRYRIRLLCFQAIYRAGTIRRTETAWQWVRPTQFGSLALSVSGRRFSRLLTSDSHDLT